LYGVKLRDPDAAEEVVAIINQNYHQAHAALSGDFAEQMPDMQNANAMLGGISILAVMVGGVGVMNTMLMAVLERTREIGVLRALGWGRRRVMGMILRESVLIGLIGGLCGIFVSVGFLALLRIVPFLGDAVVPAWSISIFLRAMLVAFFLGLLGGLYPAQRATRLQPVEALRYE
jgi:putative ABC transport system permease protein